jgi:multicomponent Na+:H+ antiporter subunit F
MLVAGIIAVIVSMAFVMIRAMLGQTVFDRILAANSFGTNVVVLVALIGAFMGTDFFLDIALTYGLINFITTIAFLRYFEFSATEEE